MKVILGILNSKTYYFWLYNKGKRKGETLELVFKPLSEIPIVNLNDDSKNRIAEVVMSNTYDSKEKISKIDNILFNELNFSQDEIKIINETYPM